MGLASGGRFAVVIGSPGRRSAEPENRSTSRRVLRISSLHLCIVCRYKIQ
jgi:hypothetical protein